MGKIGRWLDRRSVPLEKSRKASSPVVTSFVEELSKEMGAEKVAAFEDLLKSKANFIICETAKDMKLSEFTEKYLTDRKFSQDVNSSMKSNFHRTLLAKSMGEFVRSVGAAMENISFADLEKAVLKRAWNKITSKHDPEANLAVDHSNHLKQFPVHKEYSKMLSSPEFHEHMGRGVMPEGISAKMIHQIPKPPSEVDTFMSKPYHKKIESKTKSWVKHPITGWATMATKALFNAGNIGHLAEDVSTHEHQGTPITVHKFADNHKPIDKMMKYGRGGWVLEGQEIDPLHVHQIGVMDYLTNNLDRHNGNLMIGTYPNERGYNPLLAIDHERSFQYTKPIAAHNRQQIWEGVDEEHKRNLQKETPWSYIKSSSLNTAQRSANSWGSHEDLVEWWKRHGQPIKDELESQLGSIKDEGMRKHIRDNFNDRWNKMNNWARMLTENSESAHMYHPASLGEAFEQGHIIKPETKRITAGALKALPKNKRDALFTIADMVNKKPNLTYKQRQMLSGTVDSLIDQMDPKETAEVFKSLHSNPHMSTKALKNEPSIDPRNRLLRKAWEMQGLDQNHRPIYRYDHMKALADAIETIPEDKRDMLSSWLDSLRQRLAEQKQEAA